MSDDEIRGAVKTDDETYELGKRDGYDNAVQVIDTLTGGAGEYRYCTDHDPDRHTPDAATMIKRIVDRFTDLSSRALAPDTKITGEKLVDEIAEALCNSQGRNWSKLPEYGRDWWRVQADAAIGVLTGITLHEVKND